MARTANQSAPKVQNEETAQEVLSVITVTPFKGQAAIPEQIGDNWYKTAVRQGTWNNGHFEVENAVPSYVFHQGGTLAAGDMASLKKVSINVAPYDIEGRTFEHMSVVVFKSATLEQIQTQFNRIAEKYGRRITWASEE